MLGSRCAEESDKARKNDEQADDAVAIRRHGKAAAFFSRLDFSRTQYPRTYFFSLTES